MTLAGMRTSHDCHQRHKTKVPIVSAQIQAGFDGQILVLKTLKYRLAERFCWYFYAHTRMRWTRFHWNILGCLTISNACQCYSPLNYSCLNFSFRRLDDGYLCSGIRYVKEAYLVAHRTIITMNSVQTIIQSKQHEHSSRRQTCTGWLTLL